MASIQPLAATTIRSLGSGQTLTDPISLLKELIENSLDANATQITIEASPNFLDTLLVKDNGFGISSVDRAVACKPHYTSKITSFDDIVGVETLGFRGEALASAAEMSEGFSFTTRCEGENVAEVFEIARNGEVKEKRSVGAPVGTTMKVTGFLKRLPVRRETVLRNQKALMKRLRALVATYYLSRPRCRFAMKILKGGETLVYAPSKTVPEAVRKVVGKDAANVCEWAIKEGDGFTVEAFLVKRGCEDVTVLEKPMCDNYVFVDSRPVSCTKRGSTAQALWKMYKKCVKGIVGDTKAPSNPLLYMNIRCPKGIYDVNVEPAKDDVFFDGSIVGNLVSIVEELLKEFYGELAEFQREGATSSRQEKGKEKSSVQDDDFDILLARRKDPAQDMLLNLPTPPPPPEEEPDDIGMEPLDEAAIEAEKEQIRKDFRLSNPWTITKMNVPSSSTHHRTSASDSSPIRPPPDTNSSPSRAPAITPHADTSSPIRPSFTFMNNPLHPRSDGGNSALIPRTPTSKPPRKGFGIPPTPFSPPRSVQRQQQPTLLEDPENAGAIDRFIVRTLRSELSRRPIPREFENHPVVPAQIRRAERESTPEPIPPRGGLKPRELESRELEPRAGLEPRGALPSDEPTTTRITRPRGEEPFRGGFITAAAVYDEVGSQQVDLDDDCDDNNHPRKKRRVNANNNNSPHRNRFLKATAALHDEESPCRLHPLPPTFLGPPEEEPPRRPCPLPPSLLGPSSQPPEEESPRRPRPLPPSLLGRPNPPLAPDLSNPTPLAAEPEPFNPPPPPAETRPTTSHRRRNTNHTLPAAPLFPYDEEWQTHQLTTTLSTLSLEVVNDKTLDRIGTGGDGEFDKDIIGGVVKEWLERMTGVREEVKGWEVVEGEDGIRVLKAVRGEEVDVEE